MTRDKTQKKAIRARMAKTGEHYTTARHYLLDLHRQSQSDSDDENSGPVGIDEAAESSSAGPAEATSETELPTSDTVVAGEGMSLPPRVTEPGMSDIAVTRGTGKSWDEWFALLDAWGAASRVHAEIARHIYETYGIDGWWAQNVTVGYERARGMRTMNERPDGFSMNASKTFSVPVERLFTALVEEDERALWLEGLELRLRTSQPHRSARFDVIPADRRLAVNFLPRGEAKAAVQLQMERLPEAEDVARWKGIWKTQLDRLGVFLARESSDASGGSKSPTPHEDASF